MPTELFRLLNIRPANPVLVIAVDDVAGMPPIFNTLEPLADQRALTREALQAAVERAAPVDAAVLDRLGVTQLGMMLEDWQPGQDIAPLVSAARTINLEHPNLIQTLRVAGDTWMAASLGATMLGQVTSSDNVLRRVRRALKGAALARALQEPGVDAQRVVSAVARAPLAVRDPVGVAAAVRSSSRPEEIEERRKKALADHAQRPNPLTSYHLGERLQRKLLDAHAEVATQKRLRLLHNGAADGPLALPDTRRGMFGRLRSWLFGETNTVQPGQVIRADAIDSRGAGETFRARLDAEEESFVQAIFGPNYTTAVEDLAYARDRLAQFQEAAQVAAANASSTRPVRKEPGVIIDERPPIYLPGVDPGVRIAGIGDLIVVRESHKRYEAEEIAHIENILPLEERVRQHRSVRTTESIFEQETQQESESERDLRTSDRFELQSESERTIETQFGIDFGLNVTAQYGFVNGSIAVDADFGISYNRHVTESERNASSFSKEVVDRSLERIQKRARELRRVTLTETVDELNRHAISGLAVPFSGIYKWVNKVQEVELRHFGQRLMLEFYVPEPGLRLLRSLNQDELDQPPTIDFDPESIDIDNYLHRARLYEATGVNPPPPFQIIVETAHSHPPRPPEEVQTKFWSDAQAKESVPIPPGYAPTHAQVIVIASKATEYISASVAVAGQHILSGTFQSGFSSGLVTLGTSSPRGESGIAVAYSLYNYARLRGLDTGAVHITVLCQRTTEAWQAWQLETFQKYYEGNQRQWAAYREEQLTRAATSGVRITGRNPQENRIIERNELKRWSIELMRSVPFDFNGIDETGPVPNIAYDRIDGNRNINLFFERAFEWTQMAYWFFPYFWGRREYWEERMGLQDTDPLHQQFLQAGSARVLVPVTPGYEERVLYYLNTAGWEDQRVIWMPDENTQGTLPRGVPALATNPDIWMEVILSKNKELAYGTGTLTVRNGSTDVTINADSTWTLDDTDVNRELYIESFPYTLTRVAGPKDFVIDKPYAQADNDAATYLVSSVRVGAPWEVVIPTNLVVLADQADKLNLSGAVNAIAPGDILNLARNGNAGDGNADGDDAGDGNP